jgi:hypothetical protein
MLYGEAPPAQNHRTRDASDMTGSMANPPMAMNAPLIC